MAGKQAAGHETIYRWSAGVAGCSGQELGMRLAPYIVLFIGRAYRLHKQLK